MNCEELKDALNAFLNGTLSSEESRAIRRHLASCAACSSLLAPSDRIEVLPALDEEIEPSGRFAASFHSRLNERRGRLQWGYWWKYAAAVAVVVLGIGIFFGQYFTGTLPVAESPEDLPLAEDLPLLEDMAVIQNLDLLENFEAIENLPEKESEQK